MAGRRPVSQSLLDHSVTPHSLTVSGLGKIPSLTAEVNYILWDKASSPHCTDGVAEDPRGGELQAAMSQRGSWEAARPCLLSLEANSLHFLLTLVPREAWAAGGRLPQGGPLLCLQASHSPLLPDWAQSPPVTCRTGLSVPGMGSCPLRCPGSATSGKPPIPAPLSKTIEAWPFVFPSHRKTYSLVIPESQHDKNPNLKHLFIANSL